MESTYFWDGLQALYKSSRSEMPQAYNFVKKDSGTGVFL